MKKFWKRGRENFLFALLVVCLFPLNALAASEPANVAVPKTP